MWKKLKSIKYRREYKKGEIKRIVNKVATKHEDLGPELRQLMYNILIGKPGGANMAKYSKVRNVCTVTGRARAVNSKLGVSRIVFKQLGERGELPGYRKV